jgi:hypothetical protein
MESNSINKCGYENLALFYYSNKGIFKGPSKGKGKNEESTS